MIKEKLKAAWNQHYEDPTKFAKIVDDLEGDDFFSDGSGRYVLYEMEERHSEEEIAEMSEEDKAEEERDIIEDWVRERWSDFEHDFTSNTVEEDDMLLVRRAMKVTDADEFLFHVANGEPVDDYRGLGNYWSWDLDKAEAHWGGSGKQKVLIDALVPFESIDADMTLHQNLRPSTGEDEAEIYLKDGAKLYVIQVEMPGGEVVESPEPIPMTARFPTLSRVLRGQ